MNTLLITLGYYSEQEKMTKKEITEERRKQLAEAGKKGGLAKVKKGFAIMKESNPERFLEISKKHKRVNNEQK